MCIDQANFGKLLEEIENSYLTVVDQFLKSGTMHIQTGAMTKETS